MPKVHFSCVVCGKQYTSLLEAIRCERLGIPEHIYPIGAVFYSEDRPEIETTILSRGVKKARGKHIPYYNVDWMAKKSMKEQKPLRRLIEKHNLKKRQTSQITLRRAR